MVIYKNVLLETRMKTNKEIKSKDLYLQFTRNLQELSITVQP